MYAAGITDVGVMRRENEDFIYVSLEKIGPLPNLFIIADGMGGHNAGEVASKTAVEVICNFITNYGDAATDSDYLDILINAAKNANQVVLNMSKNNKTMEGMGTTLTACVIAENKALIAHVGDSRAYCIKGSSISQITEDHTYAAELYRAGEITAKELLTHYKRNQLTRVLGYDEKSNFDGIVVELNNVSGILLCSDGLTDMLDDETILNIINKYMTADKRVEVLVSEANSAGGRDNISAVLIDFKGVGV